MDTINAGETFSYLCANGLKPGVFVGDKLPTPEKAQVKVLSVNGNEVILGPLKAGEISITLPCGDIVQPVAFSVKEMPNEAAANRYHPMGSEKVEYPASLFILIAVILLSPFLILILPIVQFHSHDWCE